MTTLVMLAVALSAQQAPLPTLVRPHPDFATIRTFRCQFQEGEGRDSFTTPLIPISDGALGELVFDNINYGNRSARLIGNIGSSDVEVIDGDLAVNFVEVTSVGGLAVTTVFKGASEGSPLLMNFRAVSSRHIARTLGGETASQHYGTCKALL